MKRKILSTIVIIIILSLLMYFLFQNFEIVEKIWNLFHFEFWLVVLYFLVAAIIYLISTLRWRQIIWALGYNVPYKSLVMYNIAGFGFGYLTPIPSVGSETMRSLLLNKHLIPLKKGVTSVMINRTITGTANALFASLGMMYVIFDYKLGLKTRIILILLAIFILWLIIDFYRNILSKYKQPKKRQFQIDNIKWLNNFLNNIWEVEYSTLLFFRNKKSDFYMCMLISFFSWFVTLIFYKIGLLLVGYDASFPLLFLIIVFTDLAYIMPIPAALGVLEWGNVSALSILNMSPLMGIALSLIIRMRDFLFVLIGLGYLFMQGIYIGKKPTRYVDIEKEI